jgi:hypothetical protein
LVLRVDEWWNRLGNWRRIFSRAVIVNKYSVETILSPNIARPMFIGSKHGGLHAANCHVNCNTSTSQSSFCISQQLRSAICKKTLSKTVYRLIVIGTSRAQQNKNTIYSLGERCR